MSLKTFLLSFILCLSLGSTIAQEAPLSPVEFMPHRYGEQFTPHHLLVRYFEHVADKSDRVMVKEYGRTNQQRPLLYAMISTPENLAKLEDIRLNHMRWTGLVEGKAKKNGIAIVWLSYNVHGNEAGASESSISVIHALATSKAVGQWLKNTVVIMDPCINPDGYSRYTHWNRGVSDLNSNITKVAREHDEPWPGGRVNHYHFDLNRDWAWQTQWESRQRLAFYQKWMPHVHVDYHEMFHNDPYYFAPAAQPYHQYITPWQAEFQRIVGKNNARYFDEQGWLYFSGEVFDLLYPSYGDTYPIFNGAIGMTYEQGGHSEAGQAILMKNGDTLKLQDRIDHHLSTSLSTLEASSKGAKDLEQNFAAYFDAAQNKPIGQYKSYIVKASNASDRIKSLCTMLDRNKIRYGRVKGKARNFTGFDYLKGKKGNVSLDENDLVISAYQPQSVLLQVLFEPEPYLADSLTYDITAWALPYAFGLNAFALDQRLDPDLTYQPTPAQLPSANNNYAYLIPWESLNSAKFLGRLLNAGLNVRRAKEAFSLQGYQADPGTLIVSRGDNEPLMNDWETKLLALAKKAEHTIKAVQTGFSDQGPNLGSEKMKLVKQPKILIPSGEGTDEYAYGELWYFFEQVLGYPVTAVETDRLRKLNLDDYNVIILPEGISSSKWNMDKLTRWVSSGGHLIAMGGALSMLEGRSEFALPQNSSKNLSKTIERHLHPYEGQERRELSNSMPGAILKMEMDATHPLACGIGSVYHSLKTNDRAYSVLKNCWNVGYTKGELNMIGFAGKNVSKELTNKTFFAVQKKGDGMVTYLADNLLFRGFWYNGMLLFGNAVFMSNI